MTQFLRQWKYPSGPNETATSTFDIPAGVTNINIPSTLLQRYRNLNIEFLFTEITASDEGLSVEFYRANYTPSFNAPNIGAIGDNITFAAPVVANDSAVFLREFSNIDTVFLRATVTAPVGVTARLIVNVIMGGASL